MSLTTPLNITNVPLQWGNMVQEAERLLQNLLGDFLTTVTVDDIRNYWFLTENYHGTPAVYSDSINEYLDMKGKFLKDAWEVRNKESAAYCGQQLIAQSMNSATYRTSVIDTADWKEEWTLNIEFGTNEITDKLLSKPSTNYMAVTLTIKYRDSEITRAQWLFVSAVSPSIGSELTIYTGVNNHPYAAYSYTLS